jgi:small-conductance mechanosensitive channel
MQKENIIINSIETYPNSFGVSYVGGEELTTKGININFSYKTMTADIILLHEDFKTDNSSLEEIKDKIVEVLK